MDIVSVPLRGYGFEIGLIKMKQNTINMVSVPLRGYGFEIDIIMYNVKIKPERGFRPLAGIWF